MDYLNEKGFDCITFDLPHSQLMDMVRPPISKKWKLGARQIWTEKIESVISKVSGPKVIYSFSSPSSAALVALSKNTEKNEIKAWICDGGPFVRPVDGIENLVEEWGISANRKKLRRAIAHSLAFLWGSLNYERELKKALKKLPAGFPILSFRAKKDHLVSPDMIDEIFKLHPTPVRAITLPDSGHLKGFKEDPSVYFRALEDFIDGVARSSIASKGIKTV